MKVFISQKTVDKLESMIKNSKPDSISVKKYNKDKDNLDKGKFIKALKLSDKQRQVHQLGLSYSIYINKDHLKELKSKIPDDVKDGGFLPFLLPFLPAILGAVGASAWVGTLASTIARTVNESKNQSKQLEEQQINNAAIEQSNINKGEAISLKPTWKEGTSIDIKNFVNNSKLSDTGKRTFRSIMKNLYDKFDIKYDGEALSLRPLTTWKYDIDI